MHTDSPIHFFCAICGQSLNADARFAGSVIACPICERNVPVPGQIPWDESEPKWQPAFSPEILSVEITFRCPGCSRALVADARWGGEPFVCPKCETTSEVPNWTRARVRPPDAETPLVTSAPTLSPEEIAFLSEMSEEIAPPVPR